MTTTQRIPVRERADRARALYPLEEAMRRDGLELHGAGPRRRALCPFHDDHNPSLTVDLTYARFRCWACGAQGDVIDYVQLREEIDFTQALRYLAALFGRELDLTAPLPPPRPKPAPRVLSEPERRAITVAADYYARALHDAPHARRYLTARGVVPRPRLGIGFGRPGLRRALARHGVPEAAACAVGLLSTERHHELFAGRIIVPDRDRAGAPSWLTARVLPAKPPRRPLYRSLSVPKPLLGLRLLPAGTRTVLVVEGVFDWLVALTLGMPAIATLGPPSDAAVEQLRPFRRVLLALDADTAGERTTSELLKALAGTAVAVHLPPGVNDVGDIGASDQVTRRAFVDAVRRAAQQGADHARAPQRIAALFSTHSASSPTGHESNPTDRNGAGACCKPPLLVHWKEVTRPHGWWQLLPHRARPRSTARAARAPPTQSGPGPTLKGTFG